MENFNRYWVRGRDRAILTPRPFIQVHHRLVPPRPPQGVAVLDGLHVDQGWITSGSTYQAHKELDELVGGWE